MYRDFFTFIADHAADILRQTVTHIELVLFSVYLSVLIGVPLGIVLHRKKRIARIVVGLTGVLQTVPSIALLGLLIPFWGIGIHTAVVALFLYALLPVVRSTITGIAQIDPDIAETGSALGMNTFQRQIKIEIPLALPVIFSGIRTAAVINVGVATLAAYIAAGGLGEYIFSGIALNNTSMILSGALPAAILAIFFDYSLSLLQRLSVRFLSNAMLVILLLGGVVCMTYFFANRTSEKLTAGFAHEFAGRADGYPGLQKKYGLKLSAVLMDQSLMYKALYDHEVDIISGYSTDGRIKSYHLKVLNDDRHAFPPYDAAILVRTEILDKYPELETILKKLERKINDSVMTDLNYRAEILHQSPQKIAFEFIRSILPVYTEKYKIQGKITVGSKVFTEQYILSEILAQLLERTTELQVEKKTGLGGTKICFDALEQGAIDLYPEYSGTALQVILKTPLEKLKIFTNTNQPTVLYLDSCFHRNKLSWIIPFGFSNSYCLMMREDHAKLLGIENISDLINR